MSTAPVSPLGQKFFIRSKYATCVAAPTTIAPDPTRKHFPENDEPRVAGIYGLIFFTDRYEGLVAVGAGTLLDGDPLNNFVKRAWTFNPDNILAGASHVITVGNYVYVTCDKGLVVISCEDSTKPVILPRGRTTAYPTVDTNNSSKLVNYNLRTTYSPDFTGNNDWGYIGETSTPVTQIQAAQGQTRLPFFKNITIYGFNQHNFISYTLVNPIITRFNHDTYSYAESAGTMQNTMTVDYETVTYQEGKIDGSKPSNIITTFGNETNYDRTLSPIARPGSQATILGQGGLVDAAGGVANDLSNGNILGAIQKSGAAYNTFKNGKLTQVARSEINNTLYNATLQAIPGNPRSDRYFPDAGSTPGPAGAGSTAGNGKTTPAPVAPVKT
jgi:hypothetical protein